MGAGYNRNLLASSPPTPLGWVAMTASYILAANEVRETVVAYTDDDYAFDKAQEAGYGWDPQ